MNIKKNFHFLLEISFLVLISLIPLVWFKPGYMVYGSDSGYPLDFVNYFIQRSHTWLASQNFGMDMSTFMGLIPLHGIQYVLSIVKIPYFDIQIFTFIVWFAGVVFSMYACVRYFFKEKDQWIIRFIAVLLYSINFYIYLFWTIGSQTTLSAYILLPLCFLISFKFINKELSPFKTAVYFNLAFFFFNAGGVTGLPLLGPTIVIVLSVIAYQFILELRISYLVNTLKLLIYFLILFIILNAYFLFPFLSSFAQQFKALLNNSGGINGVIEWTRFISKFDNYSNLFRLQGDNIWYVNNYSYPLAYLTNPLLIILSFVFSILAYLNLIFVFDKRVKKLVLLLILISLIGIFLSAGAHEPLGFLYELMLKYIPGFAAFRSAYYKFIPMVYFSIALLDGIAIYYIFRKLNQKYIKVISVIFVVFILLYHLPFFQSKYFLTNSTYSTLIKVPDYVRTFSKFQESFDNNYRTIVLPPLSDYWVEIFTWDYYSATPIYPGLSNKSFIQNNAYLNSDEKQIVNQIYSSLWENDYETFFSLINRLSIKYILLTSDIAYNNPAVFRENPNIYKQKLNTKNFKLIWQKGKWSLYEIVGTYVNPKIYTFGVINSYTNVDKLPNYEEAENQFIRTDQMPKDANLLPIARTIEGIDCVTCNFLDKETIELQRPRITPQSRFYFIKQIWEKRLIKKMTDSQKIDTDIGLSLNRVSELNLLNEINDMGDSRNSWVGAINKLSSYWKEVVGLLKKKEIKSDILIRNKIRKYAQFEKDILVSIYNFNVVKENEFLKNAMENSFSVMNKVLHETSSLTTTFDSNPLFIYQANNLNNSYPKEIRIDPSSILRDQNNNLIYPYAFSIDNKEQVNVSGFDGNTGAEFSPITSFFNKLYLYFPPQQNQFFSTKNEKINFPDEKENCLSTQINNYKWYDNYRITSIINNNFDKAKVYIKFIREKNGTVNNTSFFEPDVVIGIDKTSKLFNYNLVGKQNDLSSTFYFCTDSEHQPNSVFAQIQAKTIYTSKVYLTESKSYKPYLNPTINFKTISPTEYLISIKNAKTPFMLGFSDRYSESWKLFDNNNNAIENSHFVLNGYANGWYLSKTGSYDIKLRYTQQDVFISGVKISAIAAVFILSYLLLSFYKRSKKNYE